MRGKTNKETLHDDYRSDGKVLDLAGQRDTEMSDWSRVRFTGASVIHAESFEMDKKALNFWPIVWTSKINSGQQIVQK